MARYYLINLTYLKITSSIRIIIKLKIKLYNIFNV